ncbi:MAG TPA: glycerophosphodiester phosphodiesterase family protein [Anaerolineales bacterium]|jgi:glycerophosphoryl diester phosphodiesterase|nr:glycerophosphodiester phosphodiesterase family protein [Anaerolineales bacterium]
MLIDLPHPIIFAHRGASAYAPENTIAAFELAAAQGADAIELDAKLTADGEVVVFHDLTLDRTTKSVGRLSQKTLAELRALDAGSSFSEKFRGEKIPLLSEVFEAVGKKVFINVELTNYSTRRDQLAESVCALVKRHGLESRILFSSFLSSNLKKAQRVLPQVPRGLLALGGWMGAWARSFGFAFGDFAALHPFFTDVSAQEVGRVHKLKRRIHVWTVNKVEDMIPLKNWGVDGIFTDDPQLALQAVGRQA